MMLKPAMEAKLNEQIKNEIESAYVYLSMAAYCESKNYPGFAHWLQMQAQEELAHAMRFYGFVHDRGGRVLLQAVAAPPHDFDNMVSVFEEALKHEEKITALIHEIYGLAIQEHDYATIPFLQTFISEQIEEEKTANHVLDMMRKAADEPRALLMLDRELAGRSAGAGH